MTTLAVEAVIVAVLASALIVAAVGVARGMAYLRLHRPIANRRFMARYRAERLKVRRSVTTSSAQYSGRRGRNPDTFASAGSNEQRTST